MKENNFPQIFLCYAEEDKDVVRTVYDKLQQFGLNPWMAEKDLQPGKVWNKELRVAIKDSTCVLIFMSKISVNKRGFFQNEVKWILSEFESTPAGQIFIIPVLIDWSILTEIPEELLKLQCCDYSKPDGFARLIKSILQSINESGKVKPSIIDSAEKRTEIITEEIKFFIDNYTETIIRYSGFLSIFAIDEKDPDLIDNKMLHDLLLKEKEALLLFLANEGHKIKCIITPPNRDFLFRERAEIASYRVKSLVSFLESDNPALKNIDWAISPYKQKNIYIFGDVSYYEGYKQTIQTSYSLTLRQTGLGIKSNIALYDALFKLLAKDTLGELSKNAETENDGDLLRTATIMALKETDQFLEIWRNSSSNIL